MLLMPHKKKIVSIVVSGMKDKGKRDGADDSSDFVQKLGEDSGFEGKTEGPEEASDSSYGLESSMQSFLSASKRGDAKAMASALKDFVYMCDKGDAPEGEM